MSDTEIREWALANGHGSARGPLSADVRAKYEQAHGFTEANGPTDDDFPADDDVSVPAPPPPTGEVRPRSIASPRKMPWQRDGKPKPKGKGHKRVPLDDTIAMVWRGLAGFAKPLPATSRLLKIQAPVAGKILEPVVKDTIVDKILQPLARTTAAGEAVAVLLGPPALVTAMQLNPQIIPFAMPALRELMLRMVKVAGPAMSSSLKQEREFEEEFGGTVDDLIAMLFAGLFEGGPEAPPDEDAAVRKVQEAMEAAAA